jgi:hypothetical protein
VTPHFQQRVTLAWLAKQFVGVKEDGPNKGTFVERFQKAVDNKAQGEPWCAAFVCYCVKQVDGLGFYPANRLFLSESTQTLWNKSPADCRTDQPEHGTIAVWRSDKNPALGHCGIVVDADQHKTVEGNTSPQGGDQREGDGVFLKHRPNGQIPGMTLLGYLRPWGA